MLVRIANREYLDQTASEEVQKWPDLSALFVYAFLTDTSVQNFRNLPYIRRQKIHSSPRNYE